MINASRIWLEREITAFAQSLPAGSLILDAGAGDQCYKPLFSHCQYESTDFEKVDKAYSPSTYVCDLTDIPVEDGRFEAVLFTQVMEHVPEPAAVLRELRRVLKPGGRILYTGPLVFEEHETPFDFYRYTQFGVRHLFTQAGFVIDELRPLDGTLSLAAHMLRFLKKQLPHRPRDYAPGLAGWAYFIVFTCFRPVAAILAPLAARAAVSSRYEAGGMPINYLAMARNPIA